MITKALAFDDVLITPRKCIVASRSDISLNQNFLGFDFEIPIISANMSTVTEADMINEMYYSGGMGILHRMMPLKDQLDIILKNRTSTMGASIEGSSLGLSNANALIKAGAHFICIDVAHAHSDEVIKTSTEFIKRFPKVPLIIGNVATPEAIEDFSIEFSNNGVSFDYWKKYIAFKVGIGSGSHCTTRVVTGCGLPTLQSLLNISQNIGANLIADGGIKNSGDIVKCLVAGAKMVMLGSLLAGTKEAPGNIIKYKNKLFKVYRGSASYGQKNEIKKDVKFIEGEESLVPYKGSARDVLQSLCEGIKSGISYAGCKSLEQLFEEKQLKEINLVEINNAGYVESTPHGA